MKLSELPECYRKQAKEQLDRQKAHSRNTGSAPDKKRAVRYESLEAKKAPRFNGPVDITVRTTRRRQTDHRAVEDKYFVDSLVSAGILQNDTKKHVRFLDVPEPEIGTNENTIIEIEKVSEVK